VGNIKSNCALMEASIPSFESMVSLLYILSIL
jgi:hypothetical protein